MIPELETLKMVPAYLVPAGIVIFLGVRMLAAKDAAQAALHASHRADIDSILNRFWIVQGEWKTEIRAIIDEYVAITKDTIIAVKGLESSVRELRGKVKSDEHPE